MARHNTRVMIVLYAFAVAGVVLSVDVGLAVTYVSGIAESGHDAARYKSLIAMLRGVSPGRFMSGVSWLRSR